jgi:hypothetical protein
MLQMAHLPFPPQKGLHVQHQLRAKARGQGAYYLDRYCPQVQKDCEPTVEQEDFWKRGEWKGEYESMIWS